MGLILAFLEDLFAGLAEGFFCGVEVRVLLSDSMLVISSMHDIPIL